jgi:hypothetical protein
VCIVFRAGYISLTSSAFVASASQSSSPSTSNRVSVLEDVDLAIVGSLSRRKVVLSPAGSQWPQKFVRTDTSHRPGRSIKATEATPRTQGDFKRRASTTSPITVKKRKVLLAPNREPLHSLPKSGSGTFIISSPSDCREMLVSR